MSIGTDEILKFIYIWILTMLLLWVGRKYILRNANSEAAGRWLVFAALSVGFTIALLSADYVVSLLIG